MSSIPARRKSVTSVVRTAGAATLAAAAIAAITTAAGGSESATPQTVALAALSTPAANPAAASAAPAPAHQLVTAPALPGTDRANVSAWLPDINHAMAAAGIDDTPQRAAAFLAQVGQETDGFATLTEYADGNDYNGRADLGNTQPGDGPKYKGRGALQLTGRHNYELASQALGVDFVNHPELVADPQYAFATAAWYWTTHNLNAVADNAHPQNPPSIDPVSQIINGGSNGKDDRRDHFIQVCQILKCP